LSSEPNVLPKVAEGDKAAVAECLDRYGGLIWSLARRFCSDGQQAEDAVHDIFLKLWSVADRFDPAIASEVTFVAMIARRHLIDLRRKKAWPTTATDFDALANTQMDVAERAEINEEASKAQQVLHSLPPEQQQVIKLSVYDGMSHAHISEATGISLGTVKTHLRRGMMKLRDTLFTSTSRAPKFASAIPSDSVGNHQASNFGKGGVQ